MRGVARVLIGFIFVGFVFRTSTEAAIVTSYPFTQKEKSDFPRELSKRLALGRVLKQLPGDFHAIPPELRNVLWTHVLERARGARVILEKRKNENTKIQFMKIEGSNRDDLATLYLDVLPRAHWEMWSHNLAYAAEGPQQLKEFLNWVNSETHQVTGKNPVLDFYWYRITEERPSSLSENEILTVFPATEAYWALAASHPGMELLAEKALERIYEVASLSIFSDRVREKAAVALSRITDYRTPYLLSRLVKYEKNADLKARFQYSLTKYELDSDEKGFGFFLRLKRLTYACGFLLGKK